MSLQIFIGLAMVLIGMGILTGSIMEELSKRLSIPDDKEVVCNRVNYYKDGKLVFSSYPLSLIGKNDNREIEINSTQDYDITIKNKEMEIIK